MSGWKNRIERRFERLAVSIYRHPVLYLIAVFACVAGMATQLSKVYVDTSTEGFLSPNHPDIVTYNEFRDIFGRDELLVVGVEIPVFETAFFEKYRALYEQLELEVPHTDSVDSIISARHVYGVEDELIVEDLFEHWPETPEDLLAIKEIINTHSLYKGFFVSSDMGLATIVIRLRYLHSEDVADEGERRSVVDKQITEVLDSVYDILDEHRDKGLTIHVAGSPTIVDLLKQSMLSDMRLFVKLVMLIIASVLFLLFRRISAVFFPLLTVLLSVITTISLMTALGQPIQMPTAIVPSFLLAVGVGDSIHFLTLFYRHFDEHGDKQEAIAYGLGHSGLAMFLTSLTTAFGLGSFASADILPVANMGIFTSVGVMLAFLFTVLVLPACVALAPIKRKPINNEKLAETKNSSRPAAGHQSALASRAITHKAHRQTFIDRLIEGSIYFSCHYPKTVVFVCVALLVSSLWSASMLRFSHNPLVWLPDNLPVKQSTQVIDEKLGGTISVEIVVDTGEETGIYEPELLAKIEALCKELSVYKNEHFTVAKVLSITDLIKETNRALNSNDQEFYRIPDNRQLIAQELFLLELSGADDLYRLVDRQFQLARVTITIPWIDSMLYGPFMEHLEDRFQTELGDQADITITGLVPLLGSTVREVIVSTARSYAIAFAIITLTMMVLLESFKYGVISMFPNLL
ncbi:MAG: MMPL family transporter, partial [Pseudomonadales bacterium]|nr:MMPL family transporter [Pseudomonadales bacterium]